MIENPFLEIKLNTALLPFLQEFVRLSTQFMESSRLEISRITAQISEPLIHSETARRHDIDITSDEYSQLELLAQSNFSSWRLWFHTHHLGSLWKEMISFQLQTIGGSHPLLIRFDGCSPELYLLLSQLLERCSVLWEARVVTVADPSHTLSHFFKIIDVRHYTWLTELERLYYGDCYQRYAPSVQRTREEQKAREARYGSDRGSETGQAGQPGPAPTAQPVVESDAAPESTRPSQPRRAYGPTREKLGELERLFEEKRRGRHRNLSWTVGCERAGIDPKTAARHLPAVKQAWLQLDKTSQR